MQAADQQTTLSNITRLDYIKLLKFGLIALAVFLAIAAISFIFSPPGQRYFANQTAAPAEANVDRVMVLADDALNHVYSPAVIHVEVGTTVTWEFADVDEDGELVPHNVVFSDEASHVLAEGEYSRMFAEAGVYDYLCTLHPFMEGRVVVTDSAEGNAGGA